MSISSCSAVTPKQYLDGNPSLRFSRPVVEASVSRANLSSYVQTVCREPHSMRKVRRHHVLHNAHCPFSNDWQAILFHKCMRILQHLCHLLNERGISVDKVRTDILYLISFETSQEFNRFLSSPVPIRMGRNFRCKSCSESSESWETQERRGHPSIFARTEQSPRARRRPVQGSMFALLGSAGIQSACNTTDVMPQE